MKLSVIVIDDCEPDSLAQCLESVRTSLNRLLHQSRATNSEAAAETLVVPREASESPIRARASALTRSDGEIVAFLDARYRVAPDWAEVILDAHAQGYDVIGGGISIAPDSSLTQTAIYLWEYYQLAPPLQPGLVSPREAAWFAGGNSSYKREVLLNSNMGGFASELEFHAALAWQGARFYRPRRATAAFVPPPSKIYLKERFLISRSQASHSGASKSTLSRLLAALARGVALAPWLLAKRTWRVFALKSHRSRLIPILPWFCIFAGAQTAGEVSGYLLRRRGTGTPPSRLL